MELVKTLHVMSLSSNYQQAWWHYWSVNGSDISSTDIFALSVLIVHI